MALPEHQRAGAVTELAAVPAHARVDWVLARLREFGAREADIGAVDLTSELALASVHRRLLCGYRPPRTGVPLWVWWARDRLSPGRARTNWSVHTSAHLIEHELDGHHYSILKPPQVNALADTLGALLASADSS